MSVASLSSCIESVLVFRRGAEVTRVAELPPEAGHPAEIALEGLPLCLDDSSVSVQVDGDGG